MNRRNMQRNNRMIELDVAYQMQNQQHPEPYIILGSPPNFPHSNAQLILPTSGTISSFDLHRIPEHQDGTSLYRLPQHAQQVHPVTNLELGIPTPFNFYNPYLNPASGARMFSAPLNHGSMDQLPSSSNIGASTAHLNGYGMNRSPSDGLRGSSKRNGAEGFMGNTQYFNAAVGPCVLMSPMSVGHLDGAFADYRGNHIGQSFGPPVGTWCDRQPTGVGDSRTMSLNCPQIAPSFEAVSNITGGSPEIGVVGRQRFNEGATTSQISPSLLHYAPMPHPLPGFNHPPNIQGASRHNVTYRPPPATASSRHPINNNMQYASISHPQQAPEPVPLRTGIRIYRSHRRSIMPEGIHRHRNLPHLRLLPEEGLAILEFSGHYEMSSAVDHHRDMRLDIDYMSYEELLALSEQIGSVNTGLSEEAITTHLKTRVHRPSTEKPSCSNDKNDSCVICQEEYEDNDKIGSLDCGHEYHVECLKRWLPVKNACPICKSTALNVEQKSG